MIIFDHFGAKQHFFMPAIFGYSPNENHSILSSLSLFKPVWYDIPMNHSNNGKREKMFVQSIHEVSISPTFYTKLLRL